MSTCGGLDFENLRSLKYNKDRTVSPELSADLCVVNSMQEYNAGDKLVLVPCNQSKSGISNRLKYLWKYDDRTRMIRSIGSIQRNHFFQLCWSVEELEQNEDDPFAQTLVTLQQCNTQDRKQQFQVNSESSVITSDLGSCLYVKVKPGQDFGEYEAITGMQCF